MMGHLNSFSASGGGNLNKNFPKIQMPGGLPGGGMFKLRFDWYISSGCSQLQAKELMKLVETSNSIPESPCTYLPPSLVIVPESPLSSYYTTIARRGGE